MSDTDPTAEQDSKDFAALRKRAETAEAKVADLSTKLKTQAVQLAGFKPEDGVTKLLIKEWTPESDDDVTAEAFTTFAGGYGIKPEAPEAGQGATPDTSVESQLATLQSAGDALRNASTPPAGTPTLPEQIAAAEAGGDLQKALALKDQLLEQMTKPPGLPG